MKPDKAQRFYDEVAPRIPHVDEIIMVCKSKMGNYGLLICEGTSDDLLRKAEKLIRDELQVRRDDRPS